MGRQRERRLGSGHGGDDYPSTSESVHQAPTLDLLFFCFPFTYLHGRVQADQKHVENTHINIAYF